MTDARSSGPAGRTARRCLVSLAAALALALFAACDEEGSAMDVEAGVIEVIDYGFEDAGFEDACAADGHCE